MSRRLDGVEGLRNVARLMVKSGLAQGHKPKRIRRDVSEAMSQALEPATDFMHGDDFPAVADLSLLTPPQVFRFVLVRFGLDRSKAASRIQWLAAVEAAADEALGVGAEAVKTAV